MSQAIHDLRREHDAILLALEILAEINQRLAADQLVELSDLQDFVAFLKEFADKLHHGKEEGLLFPALVEAGVAMEGGPVGELLWEHVHGRHSIAAMEAALQPDFDATAFAAAAQGYADLLSAHIEKENGVLFPLAERVLPKDRRQALFAAFEAYDDKVIGAARLKQLYALLGTWKARYLA